MGLSNFPSPSEGVLPLLVMNTLISVSILKNLLRSFLQMMRGLNWVSSNLDENPTQNELNPQISPYRIRKVKGISITQFKYLCTKSCNKKESSKLCNGIRRTIVECCVCLCKFEDEEEVSELSCKHFFHKNCLDKWFNHHTSCPLCRSIH